MAHVITYNYHYIFARTRITIYLEGTLIIAFLMKKIFIVSCAIVNICSFRCDTMCHATMMSSSQCKFAEPDSCVDTCSDQQDHVTCAKGYYLRDPTTCVKVEACPCMTEDGQVIAVCIIYERQNRICICSSRIIP